MFTRTSHLGFKRLYDNLELVIRGGIED